MSSGCCIEREDCWISWEEEGNEPVPVLNFSPELTEQLGWDVGDELYWEKINDDPVTYSLRKLDDDESTAVSAGTENSDSGEGMENLF